MRIILRGSITAAVVLATTATAFAASSTYTGTATNTKGDFKYGKVTVKRSGSKVTRVEIKSVTASCSFGSGLRVIVFNPKDKGQSIVGGSGKIKSSGKMVVTFRPDKTVEDQLTSLSLKFSGSKVTGTFSEVGPCTDKGKFTAKK